MDNNPIPTNQPNGAGNETPENIVPSPTPENTTPNPAPESTPENTPQPSQAAPISTETAETAETAMPAETPTTNETPTTPEAPVAPATTEAPATPEPSPTTAPATPAAHVAHTMNPTPATTPTSSAETPKKQGGLPVGLIIGLAIGGVILFGGIVTAVVLLLFGGKVDYEATYKSFDALETSMDSIDYGDCYKVHNRIDSSYTSSSEYGEYITGCVAEFTALESATNEFAKTSGAKHDEDIKNAFESFKSALESIYTKKSDLESQLSIYNTYHEFYLTVDGASTDVKELESAIISAASLFEDTKNSTLTEFAKGFRERGLAYVRAIDDYRNGSGTSYSDVYDKMEEFTDYIEDNAPEVYDVTGLDFTKMNDLSDAYYDLYNAVRDAYYDHI